MAAALLELLRRHQSQWLGVEALRMALNLEPALIHQKIEQLAKMGHRIESSPATGFRWQGCSDELNADLLLCGLQTIRVGKEILVYQSTDSTNDIAWQHASETGYDGLVVFTETQRSGRGRLGRSWSDKAGHSLLCSILLQSYAGRSPHALSLLPSLAIVEAIEQQLHLRLGIKWPNDVVADNKKLAGTMVESRQVNGRSVYVLGVGINCLQIKDDFPDELQPTAISLMQLVGQRVDRVCLAQLFLEKLDQWLNVLEDGRLDRLHDAWLSFCDMPGRRLTLIENGKEFTGRVVDVAVDKGLVLQLDSGPVRVFAAATTSVKL